MEKNNLTKNYFEVRHVTNNSVILAGDLGDVKNLTSDVLTKVLQPADHVKLTVACEIRLAGVTSVESVYPICDLIQELTRETKQKYPVFAKYWFKLIEDLSDFKCHESPIIGFLSARYDIINGLWTHQYARGDAEYLDLVLRYNPQSITKLDIFENNMSKAEIEDEYEVWSRNRRYNDAFFVCTCVDDDFNTLYMDTIDDWYTNVNLQELVADFD